METQQRSGGSTERVASFKAHVHWVDGGTAQPLSLQISYSFSSFSSSSSSLLRMSKNKQPQCPIWGCRIYFPTKADTMSHMEKDHVGELKFRFGETMLTSTKTAQGYDCPFQCKTNNALSQFDSVPVLMRHLGQQHLQEVKALRRSVPEGSTRSRASQTPRTPVTSVAVKKVPNTAPPTLSMGLASPFIPSKAPAPLLQPQHPPTPSSHVTEM
ncbi:hypothetical protein D9758_014398 [Tetrapyrgos nigripes]|uniref:C2H2-type domain-containing protein n=1 Tax=Tetrapyrgos nigripes TaxID=182062 RepID=A0A8H5FR91_9AGAR|nr:hypothetical protein D9758_014398 [Tetrapyrgos nigripes]